MSYPPPPGLQSSTAKPHASLPARPPPSAVPAPSFKAATNNAAGISRSAFTAFAPRSVAAQPFRTSSPAHYSAPPVASYTSGSQYTQAQTQPDVYSAQPQQQYPDATYGQAPQIRNPFAPAPSPSGAPNAYGPQHSYDPELEAQIQQWQSAYVSKDSDSKLSYSGGIIRRDGPTGANTAPLGSTPRTETTTPTISSSKAGGPEAAAKTVQREGGGTTWTDSSLLEWDPAHFRIFVGNLAGEVTDESLLKAFAKYPSVQKARVIRDKRTTKSKGFGFVSFSDGDDYFQAARDMQGKYIGSHPVLIKRATTEVKPTTVQSRHRGKHGKGGGGGGKVEHGGIQKKQPKTKGGLKVLG